MQAARGAPLSPTESDDSGPGGTSRRPLGSRRRAWIVFLLVALAAYAVDVSTKVWATRALADRDIPLVGDVLVLHLVWNPGAAFSLGTGSTVVLSSLAIAAVLLTLWFSRRLRGSLFWSLGLGLLLGGVGGNLTDRLVREPGPLRGHVVDFLMLPNWPVFNFADVFIVSAAVAIVIQSVRGVALDGTRETGTDTGTGTGTDAGTDEAGVER